jgi:hypothetical protein
MSPTRRWAMPIGGEPGFGAIEEVMTTSLGVGTERLARRRDLLLAAGHDVPQLRRYRSGALSSGAAREAFATVRAT